MVSESLSIRFRLFFGSCVLCRVEQSAPRVTVVQPYTCVLVPQPPAPT